MMLLKDAYLSLTVDSSKFPTNSQQNFITQLIASPRTLIILNPFQDTISVVEVKRSLCDYIVSTFSHHKRPS